MNKAPIVIAAASVAAVLFGFHSAPASAQSAYETRVIRVPAGAEVIVLPPDMSPGVSATPVADPAAAFPLQAFAMMHRMMADMNALMDVTMPDPAQVIQAAMGGVPAGVAPGQSGVVFTAISTGNGSCQQTIRYGAPGPNGQPVVHVSQTGNACGQLMPQSLPMQPGGAVQAPVPAAVPDAPPAHGPRLWTVGEPAEPIAVGGPHRT